MTIGVADPEATRRFYETVLAPLGGVPRDFAWKQAAEPTTGLHIGFAAASPADAEAFWRAGLEAGYRDDGAPGPRPVYGDDYFGAFLLDPDGNSAEAVVHDNQREGGGIDHLWIRVADFAAAREQHAALGVPVVADEPGLTRFSRGPRRGSFTVLEGTPVTTHFHLALEQA